MYGAASIHSELKANTLFSVHNLISDTMFNEFQLITCRNVFIYFETLLQEKILAPLHFMTEIKSLKSVVTEAVNTKKCFAVFDELFRGTNVEDALEISKTTILGLTKFSNSWFFISTHLHQLKEIIMRHDDKIGTRFIECILDNDNPVFTYKLQAGWSDLKIGQLLFEREGLDRLLAKQ